MFDPTQLTNLSAEQRLIAQRLLRPPTADIVDGDFGNEDLVAFLRRLNDFQPQGTISAHRLAQAGILSTASGPPGTRLRAAS